MYSFKLPSIILDTSILPLVRVPVLSVNSMFKDPAVSIPTIFLTRTLSLSIFFELVDNTKVIIIGNPSGTDITRTETASVSASRIKEKNLFKVIVSLIIVKLKLFIINILENKYATAIKIAAI